MNNNLSILISEETQKLGYCFIQQDETPIWKYWEEFVKCYLSEGRSEVTISNVRDALRFVIRNMGFYSIEVCNCSPTFYKALHDWKEKRGWSNATLNTYRKNTNTYFIWLEDMGYIAENNIKKVRKSKEEINEQYTLNEEQVKILMGHNSQRRQTMLERWRNNLFIGLLIFTGARPCELLGLQCKDFKMMENGGFKLVIRGRKQKGRIRYYTLPSWIRDFYDMYLQKRQNIGREESNLFVSCSKRTGWTVKGMRSLFKRLSKEMGIKVSAYSVRRYVATKLNDEGQKLEDIANYLGHTRISTTKRYIERTCALTRDCGEVMGKMG